jgi:hypothetical protein
MLERLIVQMWLLLLKGLLLKRVIMMQQLVLMMVRLRVRKLLSGERRWGLLCVKRTLRLGCD